MLRSLQEENKTLHKNYAQLQRALKNAKRRLQDFQANSPLHFLENRIFTQRPGFFLLFFWLRNVLCLIFFLHFSDGV